MSHQAVIESKDLYRDGALTIRGYMLPDVDSTPFEADCYDQEDVRAWSLDQWAYVGMAVDVEWNGVVIASESLWGIEHGTLGNGVRTNAWQMVPTRTDRAVTTMGTPLSCTIEEAIDQALTFFRSVMPNPFAANLTSPLGRALTEARVWVRTFDGPAIPLVD